MQFQCWNCECLSTSILIGLDPTTHPAILPCTDRKNHCVASVSLAVYSSTSPLRIGCELPARGASGIWVSHVKVCNTTPTCSSTDVWFVCWARAILWARVCSIPSIKICVSLIFQFRTNSSTDGVELLSKKGLELRRCWLQKQVETLYQPWICSAVGQVQSMSVVGVQNLVPGGSCSVSKWSHWGWPVLLSRTKDHTTVQTTLGAEHLTYWWQFPTECSYFAATLSLQRICYQI